MRVKTLISLIIYFFLINFLHATSTVWDALSREMKLSHETSQSQVKEQLRWLLSHPNYLQKFKHSEPFIYYITSEIKKRKLPGELALIPMIESTYNPFAHSGSGAVGIWQLMPQTGKEFGSKYNRNSDNRLNLKSSTNSSLNYLAYLNRYFQGNWLLTIAAYQSGEGTISRIVKNSRQRRINFWQLPVSNITKMYIPRVLALAEIIKNPRRYHVQLPPIPNSPYFEEVKLPRPMSLNQIVKITGISYNILVKLNPDQARKNSSQLLIPVSKLSNFNKNLVNIPKSRLATFPKMPVKNSSSIYIVISGDSLNRIAKRQHVSIKRLKQLNPKLKTLIKPGQKIIVR